jgi:hypothetical protein
MADQLPVNFQIPAEGAVASYNWTDVASGSGYVTYYLGGILTTYFMSETRFYSGHASGGSYTSFTLNAASPIMDKDFDILINRPITIKGLAIINVPFLKNNVGGDQNLKVYIRKWTGVVETDIVSATGSSANDVTTAQVLGCLLTVPTTTFKKGEYLRITIQIEQTSAVAYSGWVAHDPMEVAIAGDTSPFDTVTRQLVAQIPVRIEL